MPDSIATFPLQEGNKQELGPTLGRCYHEYSLWQGQATLVANFVQDARAAGFKSLLIDRNRAAFDYAQAEKIVKGEARAKFSSGLLDEIAEHQLVSVAHGGKIAAIAITHSACERFLWRLARFGLLANRPKALSWIGEQRVTVKELTEHPAEVLVDRKLEKWWEELERDTLTNKWDCLIGLVGFPAKLIDGAWHFDREMLSRFDEIRHNAVHHGGESTKTFDYTEFATQLGRAQLVWLAHVGRLLKLTIPAESMFLGA